MNKRSLRTLGLGFLGSAILTGAFAILVQGNVPVQGVKVSSVLGGANTQELNSFKEVNSSLLAEKSNLEATKNTLNESLNSLKEAASKQSSELASYKKVASSSAASASNSSSSSDESSADESSSTETASTTTTETTTGETSQQSTPSTSGTFTVSPGETSDEIGMRLVAEGYISDFDEYKYIVDYWDLSSVLQAGTYQLDSNMGANALLEALTHGAYYYIP